MNIVSLNTLSPIEYKKLCQRAAFEYKTLYEKVQAMLDAVKERGDAAVRDYSKKFDGVEIDKLQVTPEELSGAEQVVTSATQQALSIAQANITLFHKAQRRNNLIIETMPGITCSRQARPITKVGIYVPGGTAPLVSTVLMLAIPARLASCQEIILCTPPNKFGNVDTNILYAAQLCGITKIYKIGGVQAIAAMAYGTESVPKVSKVFGPGNQYVTAAKALVSIDPQGAAIDLPAGPSEVMVIADASARTDFVAADALSQAEHGPDSQSTIICFSPQQAEQIASEIERQLALLPRREIAAQAIANSSIIVVEDIKQALQFANDYAPEHLILNVEQPRKYVAQVINAGSVFLGSYSPESAGDYASGTNHTLPTNGAARAYGGVALDSFLKYITFQELTETAAQDLGPTVATLAALEGLDAHQRAMTIRYQA